MYFRPQASTSFDIQVCYQSYFKSVSPSAKTFLGLQLHLSSVMAVPKSLRETHIFKDCCNITIHILTIFSCFGQKSKSHVWIS